MQDKVIFGMTVGLLADGVKLLVNYLGYLLNFTDVVFWQIVASRLLEKKRSSSASGLLGRRDSRFSRRWLLRGSFCLPFNFDRLALYLH
ncbi:MAG: hypothetical protein GX050_04310 [Firmicutes bacterium]|nr:hypothetical protein [Bacillota bacterium]